MAIFILTKIVYSVQKEIQYIFLKSTLKYIIFKEDQFKWLRRHSGLDSREDFGKKKSM